MDGQKKGESNRIKIQYILNSPILTDWGLYEFTEFKGTTGELDLSDAISAVGHDSTAELLTEILGVPVKKDRLKIQMKKGDSALIFRLTERPPEGQVLSLEELKEYSYKFGILKRLN